MAAQHARWLTLMTAKPSTSVNSKYGSSAKIWRATNGYSSITVSINAREMARRASCMLMGYLYPRKRLKRKRRGTTFLLLPRDTHQVTPLMFQHMPFYAYFPKYLVLKRLKDFQSARLWHCALGRFDSKTSLGLTFRTLLILKVLLSFTSVHS